jgi:hypothetical protein
MYTAILMAVAAVGLPDGTLITIENGFLSRPIARYTGSAMNHSAVVLDGYVYEAVFPCVRRMPEADYFLWLQYRQQVRLARWGKQLRWYVTEPQTPFTCKEVVAMRTYANSQLGRQYALRGYWSTRPVSGIHCGEFAANMLAASGRYESLGRHESPVTVYAKAQSRPLLLEESPSMIGKRDESQRQPARRTLLEEPSVATGGNGRAPMAATEEARIVAVPTENIAPGPRLERIAHSPMEKGPRRIDHE